VKFTLIKLSHGKILSYSVRLIVLFFSKIAKKKALFRNSRET